MSHLQSIPEDKDNIDNESFLQQSRDFLQVFRIYNENALKEYVSDSLLRKPGNVDINCKDDHYVGIAALFL
jgi:hypothetical protein